MTSPSPGRGGALLALLSVALCIHGAPAARAEHDAAHDTDEFADVRAGHDAAHDTDESADVPAGHDAAHDIESADVRAGHDAAHDIESADVPAGHDAAHDIESADVPVLRRVHGSVTAGGFAAWTGPLPRGLAAELELFLGARLGAWAQRLGLGAYYRGGDDGLIAAGLVYEAGAARPGLVMSMHGAAGMTTRDAQPVVGGGVRAQLGLRGPLAVAASLTGHFFLNGIHTRLGLSLAGTAGLAW